VKNFLDRDCHPRSASALGFFDILRCACAFDVVALSPLRASKMKSINSVKLFCSLSDQSLRRGKTIGERCCGREHDVLLLLSSSSSSSKALLGAFPFSRLLFLSIFGFSPLTLARLPAYHAQHPDPINNLS
jgi:hypothetical protein